MGLKVIRTATGVALLLGAMSSFQASAVVTYLNCPTMQPLPVTSFMPAAMLPIKNTENAFDIGMNQVVRNAVTAAAQVQLKAINSSFNSVMTGMIEASQAQAQNEVEVRRQYQAMELAYKSQVEAQKNMVSTMIHPADPSMMPGGSVSSTSPTYRFVKSVCTAGKMQQALTDKKYTAKIVENRARRAQKIESNIRAVSSVEAMSKEVIDRHYELFCSETDFKNGLCDLASTMPNADIDAFVFLYPTGVDESTGTSPGDSYDYKTLYTYSPTEALAAFQYVKHLAGSLYTTPPTTQELRDPQRIKFAAMYKQVNAALSLSVDTLMSVAQLRDPLNTQGLPMSELDVLNYLVAEAKKPENKRIVSSASPEGQLIEAQKQLALQQRIRFVQLKQRDALSQLKAANVAIDGSVNLLTVK